MTNQSEYLNHLRNHREAFETVADCSEVVVNISTTIIEAMKINKKLMLCGNGGSASDAQHIAAEFTGRFIDDRKPLPAIALNTDCSALTCIPNDYSFDEVFSRQVIALGNPGDVLIVISTSGNSKNLVNAVSRAKQLGIKTIAILGKTGGKLKGQCDFEIVVPSDITAHIQEVHIFLLHVITWFVDREFSK
jgi:D-sedoheptulose 7-phosphate isomerase